MSKPLDPFRPVRYLGDLNEPKAIAVVPQESEHGYEPIDTRYHYMRECGCFPDEYGKLKAAGIREIPIRIGTAENPCLRYAMFRPRSGNGGFGECVARIPWTSENYHVPGICSRYHQPIVCNLRDYQSAIERGRYEEREAIPWPEPFVATHACTVCEWRGVLSETKPDADHGHVCPFCSRKNGRLRPVYEIEYEDPNDRLCAAISDVLTRDDLAPEARILVEAALRAQRGEAPDSTTPPSSTKLPHEPDPRTHTPAPEAHHRCDPPRDRGLLGPLGTDVPADGRADRHAGLASGVNGPDESGAGGGQRPPAGEAERPAAAPAGDAAD